MRPLNVYIRNIRISFKPTFIQEANPELKVPFEISLRLYSAAMNNCVQSKGIHLSEFDEKVLLGEADSLKFAVNDIRYIRTQKIFIVIYHIAKDTNCLAQAVVLLNEAKLGDTCIVKSNLQSNTKVMGEVSFEYKLG